MADEKSKVETLKPGFYECEILKAKDGKYPRGVNPNVKGYKNPIYQHSTAQSLLNKGYIKVVKRIEEYVPAKAKA